MDAQLRLTVLENHVVLKGSWETGISGPVFLYQRGVRLREGFVTHPGSHNCAQWGLELNRSLPESKSVPSITGSRAKNMGSRTCLYPAPQRSHPVSGHQHPLNSAESLGPSQVASASFACPHGGRLQLSCRLHDQSCPPTIFPVSPNAAQCCWVLKTHTSESSPGPLSF